MKSRQLFSPWIKFVICLGFLGAAGLFPKLSQAQSESSGSSSFVEKSDVLIAVELKKDSPEELIFERAGETFRIPAPEDAALRKNFEELSTEQKLKFQKRRAFVLEKLLSLFHWKYLQEGKGAILGDKIVQDQEKQFMKVLDKVPFQVRDEVIDRQAEDYLAKIHTIGSFSAFKDQLAHDFVLEKLKAVDGLLHRYAGMFINPKEFGFSASIGFGMGGGVQKNLRGGAKLIGINIGIDFESRSLVFEISRVSEKIAFAITPVVANFSAPLNVGLYAKNPRFNEVHRGSVIYAPGVPGGISGYSNYVEAGLTTAWPPLLFDFFGYISGSERTRLVRIEFSPLRAGFLKIEVGDKLKSSVVSVREMVQRWFSPKGGASCRRLYTAS